jgi:hypothetical protein
MPSALLYLNASGRQWPKIDAFIGWLRELAGEELLRFALHQM